MLKWLSFIGKSLVILALMIGSYCLGHLAVNCNCPFMHGWCPYEECMCRKHEEKSNVENILEEVQAIKKSIKEALEE